MTEPALKEYLRNRNVTGIFLRPFNRHFLVFVFSSTVLQLTYIFLYIRNGFQRLEDYDRNRSVQIS